MRAFLTFLLLVVLAGCGGSSGQDGRDDAWSATPPEGMRWVGTGRVVVAVPDWWTTGETQCGAPVEDTVYFDEAATYDCEGGTPGAVREVSALGVMDASSGYGELQVRSMTKVAEVEGREVVELDECDRWFEGVCRRLFAVPSEGVLFAVTIDEPGDASYEAIRDSVRILPEGMTTVPLVTADGWTPTWGAEPEVADALVEKLRAAGLAVEVVTAERADSDSGIAADLPEGSYLGASPDLGSVIEEGGTVTVTVAGEPADGGTAVPSAGDLLGRWRVVGVDGGAVPDDAVRGLRMFARDGRYWVGWSDGVNSHGARWVLKPSGSFRAFHEVQTLVGCVEGRCERPSGFGVMAATQVRLTGPDRLVFLADDGSELAVYERR